MQETPNDKNADGRVADESRESETEYPFTVGQTLSLSQIRRLLDDPRQAEARTEAIRQLLPRLWAGSLLQRFDAARVLTTRIYLPASLFFMEWGSFPNLFLRALRSRCQTLPVGLEAQQEAVSQTLIAQLETWLYHYDQTLHREARLQSSAAPPNQDLGADVCEACGRLGLYAAEKYLLRIVELFSPSNNQVRMSALISLASLPPERLTLLWSGLRAGTPAVRERLAAIFTYMTLPAAVPSLLETLACLEGSKCDDVVRPLLLALGTIGDPRALPKLNAIARDENHPMRQTAIRAIQRLMKEAQGQEEVTLVRASDLSTTNRDILLRATDGTGVEARSDELLRPSATADSQAAQEEGKSPLEGANSPDVAAG